MRPDWLENIPPSWSSVPFGSIFTQSKRKNTRLQRDFVLSVIKDRGVIPYTEKGNLGNKVSDDLSGYKLVDKGDFVLNSMNLYMGSVGTSNYDGVTSTAYIVCKPSEDVYAGYYNYLIQFRGFQEYVGFLGKGIMEIREAVRWTALKSVFVPLPDLSTQREIADFLDRETARIDLLIEKKQKLVALLGEKKSATIDEIVKSDEWSVIKLSRLVRLIDGDRSSEYPSDQDFVEEGIPFISSKQINDRLLTLDDAKFITHEKFAKLGRGKLRDGDVIVTVRGTLGNTAIFRKELAKSGFINAQIMIMRPEKRIDSSLLHLFTQSTAWSDQIAVEGYGSAQKQLNQDVLRRFTARYPLNTDPDRWKRIMENLFAQHLAISSRTSASIERLKEYRSALITAAVTGQIDVTTYAKSGATDRRLDAIQEEMGA